MRAEMRRKPARRFLVFFALFLSLMLILALPGCSCGDDDDSAGDGIADDDSGFDDDADDDDSALDDDAGDDDSDDDDDAHDDDADDDSAFDDDAGDDDSSGDDDADDDDSSDDDTFDDDSTDDDTVARPYDEDLSEHCVELPDDVVDLGLTELSPFQPGCPDSFVSEDGIEICVVRGSGVRTLNLVLEGDVVVDSQGNVHVITTYGRDLR
ncbi:hypothetical protein K8I61_15400, partial [bacterium]|nr:hypothetical protein [bacterium]